MDAIVQDAHWLFWGSISRSRVRLWLCHTLEDTEQLFPHTACPNAIPCTRDLLFLYSPVSLLALLPAATGRPAGRPAGGWLQIKAPSHPAALMTDHSLRALRMCVRGGVLAHM